MIPLAFAGFVLIGLGGGAGGVLLPAQIAEYGLTKSVIGLLFFAFSLGYVSAGAGAGWLMHKLGLRGSLVLGTAAFFGSALACGARPAYPVLLALIIVLAFGSGTIDACLNAYLSSEPGSTAKLNLLHAFYGVGALIGPVLAAAVIDSGRAWGWVYLLFAAFAAPLVLGFALWYPRHLPAAEPAPETVRSGAVRTAVRHPAVVLTALFLAIYAGVEVSLGNWTYSFLVEERGHGPLLAGWVVSGYWLGLTVGRFLMGAVARLGLGPVALTYACLGGVLGSAVLTWFAPGTAGAVAGFVLLGTFLGPVFPLTIAVLPRLAPRWLVPTAIGLLVGVSVVGGAFFPWLAGTLAQHVGLASLFPFVVVLSTALLANWWRIARRAASRA